MSRLKLTEQSSVKLTSFAEDGKERVVEKFRPVEYDIPMGCAAAYFPETNPLIGIDEIAERSFTPMSKFILIEISKH
jgi:hypothetical protein